MKSRKPVVERLVLERDIVLCCVTAASFPKGIQQALENLRALLPSTVGRNFFGISYPERIGKIVYKAGVEQLYDGEAAKLGCEVYTVKKGEYIGKELRHFIDDKEEIGRTFQELLTDPRIDPEGCCVEMYLDDEDVRCMVRILPE